MRAARRLAVIVAAMILGAAAQESPAHAAVTLPDLKILVPTDLISIGSDPDTGQRDLRFTHITADVGRGPFEIDPHYDARTGTATFSQAIYASAGPATWTLDHHVAIHVTGVWRPPSDYEFPLTRFTLNRVGAGGTPGAVVATSPKRDYCITGDYRLNDIPNTPDQTAIPQSDCTDPTQPLGWSVGWGDQYDQTDAGQPISLSGVRDGTYVLHALVDPTRALIQSSTANDVTDTMLRISGQNVTVLSQVTRPGRAGPAPPPRHLAVAFLNPGAGELVSGTVTVAVRVAGALGRVSIRYFVDGRPIAGTRSAIRWNTRRARRGRHTLSVRVSDSSGHRASARINIRVQNPPPPMTCFVLQAHVSARGSTSVTTGPLHTAADDETLLAFVSADGPAAGRQSASVSGGGLRWRLAARADALAGDAEIWVARSRHILTGARVRAGVASGGHDVLLSVIGLEGAGGIGATGVASASGGAPTLTLRTRAAASLVFAVGHDWDHAVARGLASGWVALDQWLDPGAGDTSWVQYTNQTTGPAGTRVDVRDLAPTGDEWNLAAVEVRGERG